MALFSSTSAQTPVRLNIVQGQVTLLAPAQRLLFCSEWGLRSERDVRLFGRCSRGGGQPAQRASLQLDTREGGDAAAVCVTLRDVAGTLLLGPVVLRAMAQSAALPA